MVAPTYAVAMQIVTGSWTDITNDVLTVNINRSVANLFAPLRAAECMVEVDNNWGDFSPQNSASRFGNLKLLPNVPLRVQATHAGSTRTLFTGKLDRISVAPALSDPRRATLSARDSVKGLFERFITTSAFVNTPVGSIFVAVLSLTAVSSFAVNSLVSNDVSPFAWWNDIQAPHVIEDLLAAGFYNGWVDTNDTFKVQERYWYMGAPIVASYSNNAHRIDYALTDEGVYNRVYVSGDARKRATSVGTVAWITDAVELPASGWVGFFVDYLDPTNLEPAPADNMADPVSSSDWLLNTASDGTGTYSVTALSSANVTFFGQTAVCTVYNGTAAVAFLTKFQLQGKSLQRKPAVSMRFDDSSSQNVYGRRDYSVQNNVMAYVDFLRDYGTYVKDYAKNPAAQVRWHGRNIFPDLLDFDFASKININEANLGIDAQYALKEIDHEIRTTELGWVHDCTLNVEELRDQSIMVLDHATYGQLDARQLGF